MNFRKEVPEGEIIPKWYGVAYYEPGFPLTVCYPIPFNLLVGGWLTAFRWLRFPPWRTTPWRLRHEYQRGYADGQKDAWQRRHP